MKLDWQNDGRSITAKVPFAVDSTQGHYEIIIERRPFYCDRGDWMIWVEAKGEAGLISGLDGADGFPRYFFGGENQVKQQMETWAERRENVIKS